MLSQGATVSGFINFSKYNSTKPYKEELNEEYVDGQKIVYKSNS